MLSIFCQRRTIIDTHHAPVDVGQSSGEKPQQSTPHELKEIHRCYSVEVVAQSKWEDRAESEQEDDLESLFADSFIHRTELWILF